MLKKLSQLFASRKAAPAMPTRKELIGKLQGTAAALGLPAPDVSTLPTRRDLTEAIHALQAAPASAIRAAATEAEGEAEPTAGTLNDEPLRRVATEEKQAALAAGFPPEQAEQLASKAVQEARSMQTASKQTISRDAALARAREDFDRRLAKFREAQTGTATTADPAAFPKYSVPECACTYNEGTHRAYLKAEAQEMAALASRAAIKSYLPKAPILPTAKPSKEATQSAVNALVVLPYAGQPRYKTGDTSLVDWKATAPTPTAPRFSFAWAIQTLDWFHSVVPPMRGPAMKELGADLDHARQIVEWAVEMERKPWLDSPFTADRLLVSMNALGESALLHETAKAKTKTA